MKTRRLVGLFVFVLLLVLAASSLGLAYQRDVLRVGIPALTSNLDAHVTLGNPGQRILLNIFEKLIHFDKDNPSVIVPQLAESWVWLDDVTVEFSLRPGVKFHNGKLLTANDVKYSIERIQNPDTGSGAFYAMLLTIDTVEVIDDLTFRITTHEPDPIFETRLASLWGGAIIPEGYVEEVGLEAFLTHPIATGPFEVVSFDPNRIVLRAFEDYWGEKPNVQELVYLEIPELSARLTALVNGEVDLISTIAPDQLAFLERYKDIKVINKPISNMHMLVFNTGQVPTDNKLVRQAMSLAIDRQTIVDALFFGGTEVPRSYQFNEYGDMINPEIPRNIYDPDKARQLIKDSGYKGEVIYYDAVADYYTGTNEAAEIIVEMWKQVGLNAQVRFVEKFWDNPDINAHIWSNTMRFPEYSAHAFQWGIGTARQDNAKYGKTWHESEAREQYNALQMKLEAEKDLAKRYEIYQEMLAIWRDEVPGTELWFAPESWAMRNDIEWDPYYAHIMDFSADSLSFK